MRSENMDSENCSSKADNLDRPCQDFQLDAFQLSRQQLTDPQCRSSNAMAQRVKWVEAAMGCPGDTSSHVITATNGVHNLSPKRLYAVKRIA